MDWEPVKYRYNTSIRWTGEHKGALSAEGKPDIGVACPPEFGGHPGIWSPEDLFVASLEVCMLTTFLFLMDKLRGKIISYKSSAEGTAQMVDGTFIFKEVVMRPVVTVPTPDDAEKAERAFRQVPGLCVVSKSVKCEVRIEPEITVVAEEGSP